MLALISGAMLLLFVRRYDTLDMRHLLASGMLYIVFVVTAVYYEFVA